MLKIDEKLNYGDLVPAIHRLWQIAGPKILDIDASMSRNSETPVFTVRGRYQPQGWTEWTQGFQIGSAILQFEATDDQQFLELGRNNTRQRMASHVTHFGVHDHGFNNVSTYGNLLRLARQGRVEASDGELAFYDMALKASSAVQAMRWSETSDGDGYIYSFNGPHSLFCDTIRSLRVLSLGHLLGHSILIDNDVRVSLLDRMVQHARSTARYNVYYGTGRDTYDLRGRVAHESIFNTNDGQYRCPSTQQGYSPFTTWTRGLAWVMVGYPEQLEFIASLPDSELDAVGGRESVENFMLDAALAACDFYIEQTPPCGIPFWDTGAPALAQMEDYLDRSPDPINVTEPVDSSAAAIGCQGLIRLGTYLLKKNDDRGTRYLKAGLATLRTLLTDPYLSTDPAHQGLLLHAVYHQPRGWDFVPDGAAIPYGESCMWGDYHLMEAALLVQRLAEEKDNFNFFAS